jgi:hypothetical protein
MCIIYKSVDGFVNNVLVVVINVFIIYKCINDF